MKKETKIYVIVVIILAITIPLGLAYISIYIENQKEKSIKIFGRCINVCLDKYPKHKNFCMETCEDWVNEKEAV